MRKIEAIAKTVPSLHNLLKMSDRQKICTVAPGRPQNMPRNRRLQSYGMTNIFIVNVLVAIVLYMLYTTGSNERNIHKVQTMSTFGLNGCGTARNTGVKGSLMSTRRLCVASRGFSGYVRFGVSTENRDLECDISKTFVFLRDVAISTESNMLLMNLEFRAYRVYVHIVLL